MMPKVSILMTVFNHESYVKEAIESCLAQSFKNFELIVVDDGSSDQSIQMIQAFRDPRIQFFQTSNVGPSSAFNYAFSQSTGDLIALMSGDDVCAVDRLRRQVEVAAQSHALAIFTHVDQIDEDGRTFKAPKWEAGLFNVNQMSRGAILKRFFFSGNFLCAPSAMIRRQAWIDAGGFAKLYFQLQDFDLWIKLIKLGDFQVIPERLLKYRRHHKSLSSPKTDAVRATGVENLLIMKDFFERTPTSLFVEAFGAEASEENLYLQHPIGNIRALGFLRMADREKAKKHWDETQYRAFREAARSQGVQEFSSTNFFQKLENKLKAWFA